MCNALVPFVFAFLLISFFVIGSPFNECFLVTDKKIKEILSIRVLLIVNMKVAPKLPYDYQSFFINCGILT